MRHKMISFLTKLHGIGFGLSIRKIPRRFWALLAAFLLAAADAFSPAGAAAALVFSETENRFIHAHPSVRVGLIDGFEPYMFIGDDGSFQGIFPDYLRLLEAKTGIAFQAAPLDLTELDAAMGGEIDLFLGLESAPRRRRMAFTKTLFSDPWVLVNQKDAPLITGVRDLEGKTVSLVDGIYIHKRLTADYPGIRIRPAKDHPRALSSVMMGQADAYIGPLSVAGHLILHNRLTHLKIAAPSGYPPAEVKFGVRKDWPELVGIIDKAISTVTRQEMDAIFRKWVPVRYEPYVDWTHVRQWIAGIVIGFGILLAVSLWWNRKLSAEIAERRRTEEELTKSQAILKKAEELSDIGGYEYDIPTGRLLFSDGWMKIHGCEHRTLSVDELMPIAFSEDVPKIEKAFDKALRNIEPYQLEHRIVRQDDGEVREIQASAEVIFDDAACPVKMYGSVQDITERKAAEAKLKDYSARLEEKVAARTRELETAQEELILKERLAVLGNLSGSISHELRNPLAAIDSSVYLLKLKYGDDDNAASHLQRIAANVGKANGIIQSLLDLTRMEGPRTGTRDLRDLIPDLLRDLGAPDGIRIETDYADAEVPADVDARQIRMALKNIMENAIQAMGGDGTLSVSVLSAESGESVIVVSDTGPGIPPEEMKKIFQPLFSTKVHGIGFGLSIAKTIIEKHGGDLTAESAPGSGASFTVALPRARKEEKQT